MGGARDLHEDLRGHGGHVVLIKEGVEVKRILRVLRDPWGVMLAVVCTVWAIGYWLFSVENPPEGSEKSVEEVTKALGL